jgi:predicted dienelactone hydrolase
MLRTLIISGLFSITLVACGGGGGGGSSSSGVNNLPQLELPAIKGNLGVGLVTETIIDTDRNNRPLDIEIWYPVDEIDYMADPVALYNLGLASLASEVAGDSLPVSQKLNRNLIVFSHGSGGLSNQAYLMMEVLASQGFILVAPAHLGNRALDFVQDPQDVIVANRAGDMSFVIDHMIKRSNTSGDMFEGRVSAQNVGSTGHSFGGVTALGTAVGFGPVAADPRISAVMPVAGAFGVSAAPITEAQYKSLSIPALLLGGTLDATVDIKNNRDAFAAIDNSPVYNVEIIGAGHEHFTNACDIDDLLLSGDGLTYDDLDVFGNGIADRLRNVAANTCTDDVFPIEEALRIQNVYGVAFFKKYLQNDDSFDDYLTVRYAELNETDVTFEEK